MDLSVPPSPPPPPRGPARQITAGPDPSLRRKRRRHAIVAIIVLLVACLVSLEQRLQPQPVPEYTRFKPLHPRPDVVFTDLIRRHVDVPWAIYNSGALDSDIHPSLLEEVSKYCDEFQLQMGEYWYRNTGIFVYFKDEALDALHSEKKYFGDGHAAVRKACRSATQFSAAESTGAISAIEVVFLNYWFYHGATAFHQAYQGVVELLSNVDNKSRPLLDGSHGTADPAPPTTNASDGAGPVDVGDGRLNSSLAVPLLQGLSHLLVLPRYRCRRGIEHLVALDKALAKLETLTEAVMEPTFEQMVALDKTRWDPWLAKNVPESEVEADRATRKPKTKVIKKKREKLAKLRAKALATLAELKATRARFAGPFQEAMKATGPDVDKAKAWMDSLVDGRGWTHLVQQDDKWVLDHYYYSVPRDLPAQMHTLWKDLAVTQREDELQRAWKDDFGNSVKRLRRRRLAWPQDGLWGKLVRGCKLLLFDQFDISW